MSSGSPTVRAVVRRLSFAAIVVLIAISVAPTAAAQTDDAQLRDARAYAARYQVDVTEALRRLARQTQAGKLQADLEAASPQTFAGLWLEHTPFRVHVAFTGNGDSVVAGHVQGAGLAGVTRVVRARHSLAQLRADLLSLVPLARKVPAELGVNVPANGVDVFVSSAERLQQVLGQEGMRLPVSASTRVIPSLSRPAADIYGGLPLDGDKLCTSGFGVLHNGTADRGVTTAGHCGNAHTYSGVSLPLQSRQYSGSHDEQWHLAPGFQVRNWVKDAVSTREVQGVTYRSSQGVGFFVCKYGRTTGYGCTTIAATDFLPSGECVPNAAPTFIRTSEDIVAGGDSGGPTYSQNFAYGQIICEAAGSFFVYVAPDYIESGLNVQILTSP